MKKIDSNLSEKYVEFLSIHFNFGVKFSTKSQGTNTALTFLADKL